jgi:hypothetical protein
VGFFHGQAKASRELPVCVTVLQRDCKDRALSLGLLEGGQACAFPQPWALLPAGHSLILLPPLGAQSTLLSLKYTRGKHGFDPNYSLIHFP